MTTRRVLIGSPVCQKQSILALFLQAAARLTQRTWTCDYVLVDDNEDPASRLLLVQFADSLRSEGKSKVEIIDGRSGSSPRMTYYKDEATHYWNDDLIDKIAGWKDHMIQLARDGGYDALLLVDSDLILHPETVESLLEADRPIVSSLFWTRWQQGGPELPQVWIKDHYWPWQGSDEASPEAVAARNDLLVKLQTPGVYEVGGLGACTLISRLALDQPISFQRIPNLSLWGEDRHFCVRAAALGIELAVDTHYPIVHVYRESDLLKAHQFFRTTEPAGSSRAKQVFELLVRQAGPKLVLSMVACNEEGRYLDDALRRHREYIDGAVIIDDGSTDATADIIHERLQGIPLYYVRNEQSKFTNEIELRRQQWNATVQLNPSWILNLDADEYFEDRFTQDVHGLLANSAAHTYCFRLYDFWNEHQYREDEFWQAHRTYRPFLTRYVAGFPYVWNEMKLHCGRFPRNLMDIMPTLSPLRLKHWGWARESDRRLKAERYEQLDPGARYGWKEQYDSILSSNPRLINWQEDENAVHSKSIPTAMK
ncbi:glycosyl transferase [Paenibacillus sp. CCS19]|uniref:glycosyltransferase n=1 Tax=Paenibacillus sp. CCS19 TaxID=3158387 RepID=UPI002564F9BA|nr:glycosyltransferase [Paenibacillus cellulosilyticus]GMK37267.1 glycosyl transferase [Paenibacillus cellulosilyticus]